MEKTPRPEKVAVVDEVRERLEGTSATILTEYRGLSVDQLAELRTSLRNIGGDFKVYKNTLVRFAARDLNLEIEDLLTGPTALAFVTDKPDGSPGDAVDVAKVLKDFGKDNPALVLKGGVLGENLLSADDTKALAEVEHREVLLAKLAGGMAAPMQKFAGLLQALPRNFAYGLKALSSTRAALPAPPPTRPPPPRKHLPTRHPLKRHPSTTRPPKRRPLQKKRRPPRPTPPRPKTRPRSLRQKTPPTPPRTRSE